MRFHAIHVEYFLEELFLSKEPFEIFKIALIKCPQVYALHKRYFTLWILGLI